MSGQERRAASTRKRHALNRLQKLEAELANLKAMPGSKLYVDLEGKIAEARKQAGVTNKLQIKGFPTTNYRTGEDPTPGASSLTIDPITGRQVVLPSFANNYTPKDLKKELGRTPEPDPQKGTDQINTGSGKFATWRPDNEQNQSLQKAFQKKNKTTTPKPTTTKPSSSRELRIKNFKPSSIQKKLINSGFTPTELVDLQIKHEDWQKNRGR